MNTSNNTQIINTDKQDTIQYLRSFRIFDMAIFDWTGSLLIALIIGYYLLHFRTALHWILWIFAWILFGVLVHKMMNIPTKFGYYLGMNEDPRKNKI